MSVPGRPSRGFAIVSVMLAIGLLGLAAFLETRIAQLEQRPELVVIIAILLVFASWTLESFSTRLRSKLDLDSLSGELRLIASATMQPASASVWLRDHGGQS